MLLSDGSSAKMTDKGVFNGYGFGVNLLNIDDSLRFYEFSNGIPNSIVTLGINYEQEGGTDPYRFRINRDPQGWWEFQGNPTGSGISRICRFKMNNITDLKGKYFGIRYTYTSARDRLFWLDDLRIDANFIRDTIPPAVKETRALTNRVIKVVLTEEINQNEFFGTGLLLTPGDISPDSFRVTGNEIILYFRESLKQAQEYYLRIDGLVDLDGNKSEQISVHFTWYEAEIYDIIISEIMADPQPLVYLPDKEYIEIYNRSKFAIDLDSFVIRTGSRSWLLPAYSIKAGEYLIITSSGGENLFTSGETIGLFSSSTVISNEGQEITLMDKRGKLISVVQFDKIWYSDSFKSEGGWSLERVDNNNVCGGSENWKASEDPSGGTPGRKNSVEALNPDSEGPESERIIFINGNTIEICFNESLNPFTLIDTTSYIPEGEKIKPVQIDPIPPIYSSVMISYSEIFTRGIIYSIRPAESISDCAGNKLNSGTRIKYGIPSAVHFLDVLISEVLFDPITGCPEYIELFNASDSLLELSDLRIFIAEEGRGSGNMISSDPVLFFPGEYIAITKNRMALMSFFDVKNPECIIECLSLPDLSDEGECIKLLNRSLQTIDEFCYSPEDQFSLLSGQQGVALERLKLDKQTGEQSMWHSASSLAGFGTPGYENSQKLDNLPGNSGFEINPEVFTPDNDGTDDIMSFSFSFEKEGYSGMVCIFDPAGRIIRYLGKNELLGTTGTFCWDGRDGSGKLCRSGIYLVFMEAFHPSGKTIKYKGTVVLAKYRN